MTWQLVQQLLGAGIIINLLVLAAAWGDMRRQVTGNRERQDERHEENQDMLHDIRNDVRRINGSVARHEEQIKNQGEEINRLRDRL